MRKVQRCGRRSRRMSFLKARSRWSMEGEEASEEVE